MRICLQVEMADRRRDAGGEPSQIGCVGKCRHGGQNIESPSGVSTPKLAGNEPSVPIRNALAEIAS